MQRKTGKTAAYMSWAFAVAGLVAAGPSAASQHNEDGAASAAQRGEVQERYGAFNPPPFEVADANKNGRLEPAEVYEFGLPFPRIDTNGDGAVTREEYLTGTGHRAAENSQIKLFE